ncbi:MAG: hypothetical protein IT330_07360 [Anaerolineae bacterium]|nr:hypothetical protein [Anaerolineae bacterium]
MKRRITPFRGGLLLLFLANLALGAKILLARGYLVHGDFSFPLYRENFLRQYYPLWDSVLGRSNFENVFRIPLRLPFLALAWLGVDMGIIQKLILTVTLLVAGLCMYLLVWRLTAGLALSPALRAAVAIFGGLAYSYNPVIIGFLITAGLVYSLAFLPLALLTYYEGLQRRSLRYLLVTALLIVFSVSHPFLLAIWFASFFLLSCAVWLGQRKISIFRALGSLAVVALVFAVLFAFYLVPFVGAGWGGDEEVDPETLGHYALSRATFDLRSEHRLSSLLFRVRDRMAGVPLVPTDPAARARWGAGSAILVGLTLCGPWLWRRRPTHALHAFARHSYWFFLVAVLFLQGGRGPMADAYWWAVTNLPLGWMFQSPLKWQMALAFSTAFLATLFLALALDKVQQERDSWARTLGIVLALALVLAYAANSLPGWQGSLWGRYVPYEIPEGYFAVNQTLEARKDGERILWLPAYDQTVAWSKGHGIRAMDVVSTRKETLSYYLANPAVQHSLLDFLYRYTFAGMRNWPGKLLQELGIGYLAFHLDRLPPVDALDAVALDALRQETQILQEAPPFYLMQTPDRPATEPFALSAADGLALLNDRAQALALEAIEAPLPPFLFGVGEVSRAGIVLNPDLWSIALYLGAADGLSPESAGLAPIFAHFPSDAPGARALNYTWDSTISARGLAVQQEDEYLATIHTLQTGDGLRAPLHVPQRGECFLLLRALESPQGETLHLSTGNWQARADTRSQFTRFAWHLLGPIPLDGSPSLSLVALDGYQAVATAALVPVQGWEERLAVAQNRLAARRVAYVWEAESHLAGDCAEAGSRDQKASNGETMTLPAGCVLAVSGEIYRSGLHRLAISFTGEIEVTVDGEPRFSGRADALQFVDADAFSLEEGSHDVQVKAVQLATLDALWLYPVTDEAEGIAEAFRPAGGEAAILSYAKVSDTEYRVRVRGRGPLFLTLRQAYDPGWVAAAAGRRYASKPVYGVLNGFYLDGLAGEESEVAVVYTPQQRFRLGVAISLVGGLAVVAWLGYDVRRERARRRQGP